MEQLESSAQARGSRHQSHDESEMCQRGARNLLQARHDSIFDVECWMHSRSRALE